MTDHQVAPDTPIEEPAPLVDEALAATDWKADDQEELRALWSEVPVKGFAPGRCLRSGQPGD